jgi:hypothetical protein
MEATKKSINSLYVSEKALPLEYRNTDKNKKHEHFN